MSTAERSLAPDVLLTPVRRVDVEVEARPAAAGFRGPGLRRLLFGLDAAAAVAGWSLAMLRHPTSEAPLLAAAFALLTLLLVASQKLYLARVCTIRAVEINRLGRAAAGAGLVALVAPRMVPIAVSVSDAVIGTGVAFGLLVVFRAAYRNWLQAGRREGRYQRPVVIVGTSDEGAELAHLLRTHPELGFRLVGVVGTRPQDEWLFRVPWLGALERASEVVADVGASGVIVAASDIVPAQLNRLIRQFTRDGVHVHLSSGLRGISHTRVRSQPLAHEPLFYVEPISLQPWQLATKRALDLVFGAIGLVVSIPILLLAALAIKVEDGGPVLFRQIRIGRHGKPFRIVKLRTMRVDAELQQRDLVLVNERTDGPLFKVDDDPRRTRVGRVLERLSIDELPQLWNVLGGRMSLVGPRPALPQEVAQFDEELMTRHTVLPGVTGLWQVEARDNPSFAAYRRYDLFYIENWSVSIDLSILVATVQRVAFRGLAALWPGQRRASRVPAAVSSTR